MKVRTMFASLAGALLCAAVASPALAEYPERDIRFIVPYGPGGGFDTAARILAERLPEYLPNDINVIVENMGGAGGRRGTGSLARSEPDGYTIGIIGDTMVLPTVANESVPFDLREMTMIGRLSYDAFAIGVAQDSPIETFEDLQNSSEPVTVPFSQVYTPSTIGALAGIPVDVVTGYRGTAEFSTALLRGDVQALVNVATSFTPLVQSGQVRVLAVFDARFREAFPAAVNEEDLGVPDLANVVTTRFLMAPGGLPDDVFQTLQHAVEQALQDPELLERAATAEIDFAYLDPDNSAALLAEQFNLAERFREFISAEE